MAAEERNGEVFTDEECTDCTERERSFDALARGLANGSISRRKALRMLGAALVGSALASIPGMALAQPPPGACKPKGAKCIVNRDCCSQNCFTQNGKLICGPVSGACFNNNDCTSLPGQDQCTRAVCNPAGVCVLEPVANCCLEVSQCPTSNDQCLKATCVNNVCGVEPDAGKSCNDGLRCTEDDRCNAAGLCVGTTKTCPPSNNPCAARTECNPATGACVEIPVNAGTVCRPAQGGCDLPAVCAGTTCPDNPLKKAGTVCREAAGPCDVAEVCTGTSNQCPENRFQPNDTPCNRDEDLCTLDTCQNGQCQAGPQKTCTVSADPCKVNVCVPATGDCVTQNAPNNTPCEDGDLCTLNDTCQNGTCRSGSPRTCPASADPCKVNVCVPATGDCVTQNAPNNTPCTDNNQCTTVDTCQNGTCQGSSPRTCPAGQTCVPATGICQCTTGVTCGNLCCTGNQGFCCPTGTRRAGQCRSNRGSRR